jgi:hypothetical protein
MSRTKEGSSREAGDKLPVPGVVGVQSRHGHSSHPGVRSSREWESATSRKRSLGFGDVKGEGPFRVQMQSVLHGSGSSFALAAGNR